MKPKQNNKVLSANPMVTVQIASDIHRQIRIIALQRNETVAATYDRVLRSIVPTNNNQPAA